MGHLPLSASPEALIHYHTTTPLTSQGYLLSEIRQLKLLGLFTSLKLMLDLHHHITLGFGCSYSSSNGEISVPN